MLLVKGREFVDWAKREVTMTVEDRRALRNNVAPPIREKSSNSSPPGACQPLPSPTDMLETDLERENWKLMQQKLCTVCMDKERGVVFLPCGHLVSCVSCAPSLTVSIPPESALALTPSLVFPSFNMSPISRHAQYAVPPSRAQSGLLFPEVPPCLRFFYKE